MKKTTDLQEKIEALETCVNKLAAERDALTADNVYLCDQVICWARECDRITFTHTNKGTTAHQIEAEKELANTAPATAAAIAALRAEGVEGIYRFNEDEMRVFLDSDVCALIDYYAAHLRRHSGETALKAKDTQEQ